MFTNNQTKYGKLSIECISEAYFKPSIINPTALFTLVADISLLAAIFSLGD